MSDIPEALIEFLAEVDEIQQRLVQLRITCPRPYYKLRQGLNDAYDVVKKARSDEGLPE